MKRTLESVCYLCVQTIFIHTYKHAVVCIQPQQLMSKSICVMDGLFLCQSKLASSMFWGFCQLQYKNQLWSQQVTGLQKCPFGMYHKVASITACDPKQDRLVITALQYSKFPTMHTYFFITLPYSYTPGPLLVRFLGLGKIRIK